MRVIPRSVQIVCEDRPLLRIVEGDDVIDYELSPGLLTLLAKQVLDAHHFCQARQL